MRASIWRAAGTGALVSLLSGCGVLYSESRDTQAKASKAAWEKVDVPAQVAQARKTHAALLADQFKASDEKGLANRAIEARLFATDLTPLGDTLVVKVKQAITTLAPDVGAMNKYIAAVNTNATAQRDVRDAQFNLQRGGLSKPASCENSSDNDAAISKLVANGSPKASLLRDLQAVFVTKCEAGSTSSTTLKKLTLPAGALADARRDADEATQKLADAKLGLAGERKEFEDAFAAYKAASDTQVKEKEEAKKRLTDAKKALVDSIKKASETGKLLDAAFGTKLLGTTEQDSVDRFLSTLATNADKPGTVPDPNDSHAGAALILISDFADATQAQWADIDAPNLVPLLLVKNLAQAKADAASREIDTLQLEVDLKEQKYQLLKHRFEQLNKAQNKLTPSAPIIPVGGDVVPNAFVLTPAEALVVQQPTAQAFTPVGPKPPEPEDLTDKKAQATLARWNSRVIEKTRIFAAAAYYLDDVGRLRPDVEKVYYQLDALPYERVISVSEANLSLWTTTITSLENQVAVAAAAGIKGSDIKALIDSVALVIIAKGVN